MCVEGTLGDSIDQLSLFFEQHELGREQQQRALCIGHATRHLAAAAAYDMRLAVIKNPLAFGLGETVRCFDTTLEALPFLVECFAETPESSAN